MKKMYVAVLLILLMLFATAPVYCAEVGNLPDKNGFELGLKCDSAERDVELKNSFEVSSDSWEDYYGAISSMTVKITDFDAAEKTNATYLKPSVTFLDGALQIYGKIGSVSGGMNMYNMETTETYIYDNDYYDSHSRSMYTDMSGCVTSPRWDGKLGSYYGIGIKYAQEINNGIKIGVDLQYAVSRFKNTTLFKEERETDYENSWGSGFSKESITGTLTSYEIVEPQISFVVSKELNDFNIYGGATYSLYQGKAKGNNKTCYQGYYEDSYGNVSENSKETSTDFSFKTKSSRNLGLFLGGDYALNNHLALNAEIAVGNEQRLSVGGLCKF